MPPRINRADGHGGCLADDTVRGKRADRRGVRVGGYEGTRVRSGMASGGQAGGRASQAVDVGGQKRRQAAVEAVVEVSGG